MWDVDIETLKELDPKLYLQKMIDYGLFQGKKISLKILDKYIDELDIDENIRTILLIFLEKYENFK